MEHSSANTCKAVEGKSFLQKTFIKNYTKSWDKKELFALAMKSRLDLEE